MGRRRRAEIRRLEPDLVYSDTTVTAFVNKLMRDGKKNLASRIFYVACRLIQDRSGQPLVLEVNSMTAWQGLQRVARTRIADSIVAPFLDACLGPTEASLPRGQEGA